MIAWAMYRLRWWKWYLIDSPRPFQQPRVGVPIKPVDAESFDIMTDRWLAREPKNGEIE